MSEDQSEGFSNRPVHTIRVGNVQASIWRNQGESGDFVPAQFPDVVSRTSRTALRGDAVRVADNPLGDMCRALRRNGR
jgi:hypothetical protein